MPDIGEKKVEKERSGGGEAEERTSSWDEKTAQIPPEGVFVESEGANIGVGGVILF